MKETYEEHENYKLKSFDDGLLEGVTKIQKIFFLHMKKLEKKPEIFPTDTTLGEARAYSRMYQDILHLKVSVYSGVYKAICSNDWKKVEENQDARLIYFSWGTKDIKELLRLHAGATDTLFCQMHEAYYSQPPDTKLTGEDYEKILDIMQLHEQTLKRIHYLLNKKESAK